jgi:alkanesulfonate monooxygenase SsuD/methylene tetrahydromethanopterin reductase-like flavin-dependent oxidoreductase (luciferase family)
VSGVRFGMTASAAGVLGEPDKKLYRDLMADVELGASLGYGAVWVIEHHFSDYFPTPNPLMLLSNVAARFPELALGTAVLVTPWHDPRRLAEEIAMLAMLTKQDLLMGLGRGTAKNEFDTFELSLSDSSSMFEESVGLLRAALGQDEFTFSGNHYNVTKPVALRPRIEDREQVKLFGALGTPKSGDKIARMGLAPLARVMGPVDTHAQIVEDFRQSWRGYHADQPVPTHYPIMITTIIEDTAEEAMAQAKRYIPIYMQQQLDRYTPGETDWTDLPDYKSWIPQFESMRRLTDPEQIPSWAQGNFVGTPDQVAEMVRGYIDAGFNEFLIQTATPGVPVEDRQRWWKRFATEVVPQLDTAVDAALTVR